MWEIFRNIDIGQSIDYVKKGLEGALKSINNITNPSTVKVATDPKKQSEKSNSTDLNTPRNSSTPSDPEHTHRSISHSSSASSSQNKLSQRTSNHSTPKPSHHPDERASSARRANSMARSNIPSSTPSRVGTYPHSLQNTSQSANLHPASLKPMTNLSKQKQPQTPLTGQGARDAVLTRGIRPTGYQSGDVTKAKKLDLENIGKKLAKLEFELSRTKIRKGNLNIVKYRPGYGSYNEYGTSEYKNDESEKRREIEVLNEDLLNNYSLSDIKKVYTSKNTELQRLKNTPSVRPSAPLVVTETLRGNLIMR